MQISSFVPGFYQAQTALLKSAMKSISKSKEDFSSHFSSPDDVAVGRDGYGTLFYGAATPYVRFMEQYDRWKAQTSEEETAALPDSVGLTEENIAYLKDRYSGDLTWMEREDALNTMKQMGIINDQQKFSAHNSGGWVCLAVGSEAQREAEMEKLRQHVHRYDPLERDWNVLLEDTPISGFCTIDDILSWVERLSETTVDPLRCKVDRPA